MLMYVNQSAKCIVLITATLLSSCAFIQKKEQPPIPNISAALLNKQHLQKIASIDRFTLKGRLAVITKPKNHSARLNWQHNMDNDHIDIYTPLGRKVAEISKTAQLVTLTDNKNKTLSAEDVESLTEKTLGFRLPLSGLKNWALGKPHDQGLTKAITWDVYGHTKTIDQNGWHIQYKNYIEQEGYTLPKKIFLKNDKLTIKLIVDNWLDLTTQPQP